MIVLIYVDTTKEATSTTSRSLPMRMRPNVGSPNTTQKVSHSNIR